MFAPFDLEGRWEEVLQRGLWVAIAEQHDLPIDLDHACSASGEVHKNPKQCVVLNAERERGVVPHDVARGHGLPAHFNVAAGATIFEKWRS